MIHIAGTKGKGSTSAFVASILEQYLPSPEQSSPKLHNVGLFTSPHLRFVRERIQINNVPISNEMFSKYFFELWDRYEAAAKAEGKESEVPSTKPAYFRYLNLMALHAYLKENVDSAVIECGIGGEYDSTNIIVHPKVTAVTSLGIDHVAMLGSTIGQIAWHKAGIFKQGAPAFTAPQPEEAMEVLRQRAVEKGVHLHVVERHPALQHIKLGLSADFQKTNASLAISVAAAHLRALGHSSIPDPTLGAPIDLPPEFVRGLERVKLSGRCEVRRENNLLWHLDGGHTLESIELAARWFAERLVETTSSVALRQKRILIFNQQTRDAGALARALYGTLQSSLATATSLTSPFTHAIFTPNVTFSSGYAADMVSLNTNAADVDNLSVQRTLANTWAELDPSTSVKVVRSIEEAIGIAREIAVAEESEVLALITGSLHLVGGALEVLETTG